MFHGPRVDGFDLISLESDTHEGAGDRGSLPHEGSRGSDPGSFGLTMGWLLDRTLGSDPVHQGSSMP